jgi:hypothetical protein
VDDYRNEIPVRAFVNALIIDEILDDPAFASAISRSMAKVGVPEAEYQFKNPAYLAGLLYCLVVVPKEVWIGSENHPLFLQKLAQDVYRLFNVELCPSDRVGSVHYLLTSLRNSLSHANFAVNEAQGFVFWDHYRRQPPHWRASIDNGALMSFISAFGHLADRLRREFVPRK